MEKATYSPGEVLCYEGQDSDKLYILISGELEVLIANTDADKDDMKNLPAQSKRVGVIREPKTPFGEISFILGTKRNATIRAVKESTVAELPGGEEALAKLIKSNPTIGISIDKTLLNKCLGTYGVIDNSSKILEQAEMYFDNFCYLYQKINPKCQNAEENLIFKHGVSLTKKLEETGVKIPDKISLALLETNLCKAFGVEYGIDLKEIDLDWKLMELFKGILYLPEKVLKISAKLSPYIIEFCCRNLSSDLQTLNEYFIKYNAMVDEKVLKLCASENSVYAEFFRLYEIVKKAEHPNAGLIDRVLSKLTMIVKDIANIYLDLYNNPIKDFHKDYLKRLSEIKEKEAEIMEMQEQEADDQAIKESDLILENNFSMLQALGCSDKEVIANLEEPLNKFKTLPNKFETSGDARKIKKDMAVAYWNFYKDVCLHYLQNKNLPNYVLLMLRYGLLDETVLTQEHINGIKLVPVNTKCTYPIYFADEWLKAIYNGKKNTSINGLGQTYQEFLKESGKEVAGEPADNMLFFEIDEVISSAVKSCAGMISNQCPIMDSEFIPGDLKEKMITKEKLEQTIKKIKKLDFSLFYREVRIVHNDQPEFVQKEIIPDFIIVPVSGSRVMCWQEIDGRNKASRGRIMIPLIPTEDLTDMLMTGLANFKWELAKTIAGHNWGDPVEGGVTGKYFDYCSTYKQSSEISKEVKEKVSKLFKKLSTTRDRFSFDYCLWLRYEAQGIQKLNKLTREMFFNYVPLPKKLRKELATNPNYEKFANRFENLRAKDIKKLETKINKMEKDTGSVPKEMHEYLAFLKK